METPSTATEPKDYELLDDEYPNYDLSFKVIIIGNSGVGKSCLSIKATKNKNIIDINIVVFSKGEDNLLSQRMKKQTFNTMKLNTIPNALESIEEKNSNIKKHNSATNLTTIAKIDDDISHNDYFNNSQIISHKNTIDDVN